MERKIFEKYSFSFFYEINLTSWYFQNDEEYFSRQKKAIFLYNFFDYDVREIFLSI